MNVSACCGFYAVAAAAVVLGGASCTSSPAEVGELAPAPSFQEFTDAELKDTMWQLAELVSELDAVMRSPPAAQAEGSEASEGDAAARRAAAARILDEMLAATRRLGPGGWPSTHPVVGPNVDRFRLDLRAARHALQQEPPSEYLAGTISESCLLCHEARVKLPAR